MASSVRPDVDRLQAALQTSLVNLGYDGGIGQLPFNLGQNEKLFSFVQFVTEKLNTDHHIKPDELSRFQELRSAGAVLEGEPLKNALSQLGCSAQRGHSSTDTAAREVEKMRGRIASLKAQLVCLTRIKDKLSEHYASLAHERDNLTRQRNACQQHYHNAMETTDQDNAKVNVAAKELESSVQSVCLFHQGEEVGPHSKATPRFLCQLSQDSYHSAEDKYLSELTAYTKKQFFEGIASMAAPHTPDDPQFGDLDLGNTEQVLLRGVSQEQHQRHCQELARLQAIYPITEMKYVNVSISEKYALAAISKAEEEFAALEQSTGSDLQVHDDNTLESQIKVKQSQVSKCKSQIAEISENVLPALLRDMSTLAITRVLHGDRDLKLARQDYFTSKQRKIIAYLQSQRARQELLSMLYEVDLRRHRETHRLFTATAKQLVQWKSSREKRIHALKSTTLVAAKNSRLTIDSDDKFAQRVCILSGVGPGHESPFISVASLRTALEHLADQLSTTQAVYQSRKLEQSKTLEEQEELIAKLHVHDEGTPVLTTKDYTEECTKLKSVVVSMEKNIKGLLKQYDAYKKTLQADPSLIDERKLFVYFFNDPSKLQSVIAELSRKVDVFAGSSKLS